MKTVNLRLAGGSPTGPRSGVWGVKAKKNQVYVWQDNHGGVEKLSFHTPLYCARAFDKAYGVPAAMNARQSFEWQRAETPVAGAGSVTWAARIGIATDFLSTALEPAGSKVRWISPAPAGMTTFLEFVFTRDKEKEFREFAALGNYHVAAFIPLDIGESFAVCSSVAQQTEKDFRMPASHFEKRDVIISALDLGHTGRPLRLTIFKPPKDGECLLGWEFGGYFDDGSSAWREMPTFSRTEVIDRKWKAA
jgi:hypothetical protein